ncbi:MAG: hypothetical protein M1834_000637 [Cirrosporium novae-zelandiae]|nr:MAG: hypothetical protein M1834_000637 [Cirrosporium novae-zelandiae]
MAPTTRPDHHINLNYLPQLTSNLPQSGSSTANTSPIEPPGGSSVRSFGNPNGMNNNGGIIGSARLGAGSPSHELGGRLFSKRAREIQAQEGVSPGIWGPPTSGHSTPLREAIPESPSQDGFPDLIPPSDFNKSAPVRRPRAGTVPSRFPQSVLGGNSSASLLSKTSRPTPSTSPFKPASVSSADSAGNRSSPTNQTNSALLSRLRAGSMPQRVSYLGSSGPFGPSLFTSGWTSARDRSGTLASIRSSEGPDSPAHSSFSKDGLTDTDVKTLDYLGLAETPQQARATLAQPSLEALQQQAALQPYLANLAELNKSANRFRSYSVNAKERYAEEEEDDELGGLYPQHSGTLTPSAAAAAAAVAATQLEIHQHNLAVQAFANHASASRPRARTAGVLDIAPQRSIRGYVPSRLDSSLTASDLRINEAGEYENLSDAIQAMQLAGLKGVQVNESMDENNLEGPTRALWIGSIPVSTTVSSLEAIFGIYGKIESTRVLTQKNCGFVNFEHLESAIQAKSLLNGKEIFPGAGPVRIGYAKVPTSAAGTPGQGGQPSSTPDPTAQQSSSNKDANGHKSNAPSANGTSGDDANTLQLPNLSELQPEIVTMVQDLGATEDEALRIASSIHSAVEFDDHKMEIPPIPEPSHTRVHDAPRLRDIRKRIDNNACSQAEIEEIAIDMLPEIGELASDYLGNTVVQKLFEYCSEPVKEKMLEEIAPHLAEIGVHKNGTWAAQKIIDVAKTPAQLSMVVQSLHSYTVPLFLDQYGNYVLQCCLRFGAPWNDYIFQSMLARLWEIAQGRFGARAMRACLESHHATKEQQRMLAAAIVLHSMQLATNTNGALLLTWFLDTCTFQNRRTVLAPRLEPHLVQLCTHKVAYLTVLKIINQRNEPEAREAILKALFFTPNDQTLEDILRDQACGAQFIFKVLTTPFFDESMRADVVNNVRNVLMRLKATPSQGYKRLMDEVGLSSRSGGGSNRDHHHNREHMNGHASNTDRQRNMSQQVPYQGHMQQQQQQQQQPMERQYSGQYFPSAQQPFDQQQGLPRMDTTMSFDQYNVNNMGSPIYTPTPVAMPQYQQALLNASSRGMSPNGFYPTIAPPGYGSPSPSLDNFRNQSPVPFPQMPMGGPMLGQNGFPSQSFGPLVGGSMYQYPQYFPPQQPLQQQAGGRRGRVSIPI